MEEILTLSDVHKQFGDLHAVDRVSFGLLEGEIFGFLGPNGAGKTTTIRMIMDIIEPDSGSIEFKSPDLKVKKSQIGYLPEERGLYDDAKTGDVLEYLGVLKGLNRKEARSRTREWLERLDLATEENSQIKELSKGMAQKVQFVASVLHRPRLAILDEPFAGLDPVNQDLFKEIIRELKQQGTTILLSSHRMNMVEELCDRIFMIHRGEEVLYGGLSEIKEDFGLDLVELDFIGEPGPLEWLSSEGLVDLRINGNSARFYLEEGYSPDRFLRTLPEELEITEISVKKPPLHDIFVATARGGTDEQR